MSTPAPAEASTTAPVPSAFWPCAWLALVLIGAKAAHWGSPEFSASGLRTYVRDLAVSTHADVLFVVGLFLAAEAALALTRRWPRAGRVVSGALLVLGVVCTVYAVASVQIFAFLRSPLTYPLLYLAGDMKNMRSSVGSFVSLEVAAAFVLVPLAYIFVVRRSAAAYPLRPTRAIRAALAVGVAVLLGYAYEGRKVAEGRWSDRADVLIAQNPHWVIAASFVDNALGSSRDRSIGPFGREDLADFEVPDKARLPTARAAGRPRNVLVVVLESTSARWLSLYGSPYPTTPHLEAEAAHALTFDSFYAHVGLTANSMAAMTLSLYPYMTWREYTVEYPEFPGVALGNLLKPHGFRTAFLHPGDLGYVGQERFLQNRGFDVILDLPDLPPSQPVSSWGGEDRVLVDGLLNWIDQEPATPFYAVAWTTQSHHPYEPVPGQPLLDFFEGGELPPDDYDLGRYLNTVAEVDRQLGRLFAGLRERGLADDTLVVITGDHGEAFGHPHPTWGHGFRLYDESVRIPFVLWNPKLFAGGKRSATVGGHVDLNPTVADLLGIPAPASWEGRSLFAPNRPPRVYFYAANDDYLMGVREGRFKYIYNVSRGREELYDLAADPDEQKNVAAEHPDRCRALRRRLAAWKDHVGRHLARARESGKIAD